MSLETYFDIQFMVMEDPNGLEVRLVECTEQQLVDTDIRTATEEQVSCCNDFKSCMLFHYVVVRPLWIFFS